MRSNKSVSVNNSQIKDLAAPIYNSDAVNKSYVDTAIINAKINGSIDNLVVTDAGDYYIFDITNTSGPASIIDQGDYLTLSIN